MQVSVEKKDGLVRIINVTVAAEKCASEYENHLRKVAKEIKLDGFRPGKVPLTVIKQKYSESILQEVAGDLMRSTFSEAVEKAEIVPAGMPTFKVNKLAIGQDFEYAATVEVFPEIELKSLTGKKIESYTASLKPADLDIIIQRMREQYSQFEEVNRPAQEKDEVTLDFDGYIDGKPLEHGQAFEFKIVLGSNTMIPGFETGLIGKKAGDEFEMPCQFPAEYHHKDVAGKDVSFKIKVHKVSGQALPPLDESFFEKFNLTDKTLEGFKAHVEKDVQRDLKQRLRSLNKKEIFDALVETNPITVPTPLVEQEIDNMLQEAKRSLGNTKESQRLNIPRDIFREEATRRVHLGLLVQEVIEKQGLKLDESRLESEIETMSQAYEDADEYKRWVRDNPRVRDNFAAMVLEDMVAETLAAQASVETVDKAYDEIINPTGSAT